MDCRLNALPVIRRGRHDMATGVHWDRRITAALDLPVYLDPGAIAEVLDADECDLLSSGIEFVLC